MRFKIAICLCFACILSIGAYAQKTANYSSGKPGTGNYQGYSFWTKDGKPSEILFSYGKDRKQIKASYAGKVTYKNKAAFKMTFPNKKAFYVIPAGNKLNIVNTALNKTETFSWEYEGPVNGVGTFCNVCAEDEKDAMGVIDGWFMK